MAIDAKVAAALIPPVLLAHRAAAIASGVVLGEDGEGSPLKATVLPSVEEARESMLESALEVHETMASVYTAAVEFGMHEAWEDNRMVVTDIVTMRGVNTFQRQLGSTLRGMMARYMEAGCDMASSTSSTQPPRDSSRMRIEWVTRHVAPLAFGATTVTSSPSSDPFLADARMTLANEGVLLEYFKQVAFAYGVFIANRTQVLKVTVLALAGAVAFIAIVMIDSFFVRTSVTLRRDRELALAQLMTIPTHVIQGMIAALSSDPMDDEPRVRSCPALGADSAPPPPPLSQAPSTVSLVLGPPPDPPCDMAPGPPPPPPTGDQPPLGDAGEFDETAESGTAGLLAVLQAGGLGPAEPTLAPPVTATPAGPPNTNTNTNPNSGTAMGRGSTARFDVGLDATTATTTTARAATTTPNPTSPGGAPEDEGGAKTAKGAAEAGRPGRVVRSTYAAGISLRLWIRISLGLLLIVLAVGSSAVLSVMNLTEMGVLGHQMALCGQLENQVVALRLMGTQLLFNDSMDLLGNPANTAATNPVWRDLGHLSTDRRALQALMERQVGYIERIRYLTVYGSQSGYLTNDTIIDNIWFEYAVGRFAPREALLDEPRACLMLNETDCVPGRIKGMDETMVGLMPLLARYLASARMLSSLPAEELTPANPYFEFLFTAGRWDLGAGMRAWTETYQDESYELREVAASTAVISLVFGLLSILITFVALLLPLKPLLWDAANKTKKMIELFPEEEASGALEWRDAYSVGVPALDADHMAILEIGAHLLTTVAANERTEVIEALTAQFWEIVSGHFAMEDQLMADHGFPRSLAHAAQHKECLAKIKRITGRIAKGQLTEYLTLDHILRHWMVAHVDTSDRDLAKWLIQQGLALKNGKLKSPLTYFVCSLRVKGDPSPPPAPPIQGVVPVGNLLTASGAPQCRRSPRRPPRRDFPAGRSPRAAMKRFLEPDLEFALAPFVEVGSIGSGAFGKVVALRDTSSDPPAFVALKQIPKRIGESAKLDVLRERDNLKILTPHRNIIDFLYWAESSTHYYFRFSLARCQLQSLVDLRGDQGLNEEVVLFLFRQIVDAIAHCHVHRVVHRDLKLNNILLDVPPLAAKCREPFAVVKLIDFGLSADVDEVARTAGTRGNHRYLPPEVLAGVEYGFPVDIWGLGLVLMQLLAGPSAFPTAYQAVPGDADWDRVRVGQYTHEPWARLERRSPAAASLVRCLLDPDPARRPSFDQIREHPWTRGEGLQERLPAGQTAPQYIDSLFRESLARPKAQTQGNVADSLRRGGIGTEAAVQVASALGQAGGVGATVQGG
ncbi:putative calmodulin-dependent kinase [Paratrimastix pyriformis]|uniref:Calmodulin-dependent kinase n=1 Tax=Paratrimastix pyriformis TaxID=342808 RepID=A0ABQ8UNC3_9EUKA|nr:putative calmodulin-dependent kinase [Paratrimastix pyriformis]